MTSLTLSIRLAAEAHDGQFDKSGQPYILHPLHLMAQMETEEERCVAVLHDVVEDTRVTLENLRAMGFVSAIADAVDALTKRPGEDYGDYLGRVESNPLATKVKIADLEHNLDPKRLPPITSKDVERIIKYDRARRRLISSLAARHACPT